MSSHELEHLLQLRHWDQLDSPAQEAAARAIAARLPEPFRFAGLEQHELGQQRHHVAFFTWNEARFALIPGGSATLGYAPGSFRPTEAHQHSWEETCRQYPEMALEYPSLEYYLENHLTALRQVTFQPFLLEMRATDLAMPVFDAVRQRYRTPFVSYPQTQERLAQEGFRFSTSDEWEYACGAGARTLWRWGDECPMIPMRFREHHPAWDQHLRLNAFGLLIADDPYHVEFTAEFGVLRGVDGGGAVSVGAGRLVEWLALASAHWWRLPMPKAEVPVAYLRRAYSLLA